MTVEAATAPHAVGHTRRRAAALVLVPMFYAVAFNASLQLTYGRLHGLVVLLLVILKLGTLAALVVGVHRIGNDIRRRPSRATTAAAVWAVAGVGLVAVVGWAKEQGATLGVEHLWPGRTDPALFGGLDRPPGVLWRPATVIAIEIVTVVVLAAAVATVLRVLARRPERGMVTGAAVAVFVTGLLIYDVVVGWPIIFDYDSFVGDVVSGALGYELIFFAGPVDPIGAVALAVVAGANGLILAMGSRS